jgi:hypothetical protein
MSFVMIPVELVAAFLGSFRKNNIIANVGPPKGRFIQKHHL